MAGPSLGARLTVDAVREGGAIVARFLIAAPHTPEECRRALDEVMARGPEELARYDWGCADGDHTGYAVVEAGSKAAVEATIPAFLRSRAKIVELRRYTLEQVRSLHRGL
jgi:hypothetical protein